MDRNIEQATYDRARGMVDEVGGGKQLSTIRVAQQMVGNVETYIVESVKNDEGVHGFFEWVGKDGTIRFYAPPKVMKAIYRHKEQLTAKARRAAGKAHAARALAAGVIPFQRKA